MVDLDSNPTKLLEVVEVGKQLLMTRGALTTFSIANDVAKYFAILPAMFIGVFPEIAPLNVMKLASPLQRHPLGGDLQRAHHRRADPARAARRALPADRRRRAAAPLAARLRRGRRDRALRRNQGDRSRARRWSAWCRWSHDSDNSHRLARHGRHAGADRARLSRWPSRGSRSCCSRSRRTAASCSDEKGQVVGSELIGQPFANPGYLQPRPSAAGSGYDAAASSGSNLGATSTKLHDRATADVGAARRARTRMRPGPSRRDLVTASGAASTRTSRRRPRSGRSRASRGRGSVEPERVAGGRRVASRGPRPGLPGRAARQRARPEPGARPPVRETGGDGGGSVTATRPRAEDFLELVERARRGRLKLYIGFAAGVGKTYRMLEEAHALRAARRRRGARLRRDARPRGDRGADRRASRSCRAARSSTAASRSRRWTSTRSLARKPAGRDRRRDRAHQRPRQPATRSATRTCSSSSTPAST